MAEHNNTKSGYFNHIIHLAGDNGKPLCNATVGDTKNTDQSKVNCNKCRRRAKIRR